MSIEQIDDNLPASDTPTSGDTIIEETLVAVDSPSNPDVQEVAGEVKADENHVDGEMERQFVKVEYNIAAPGEIDPKRGYVTLDLPTNLYGHWMEQFQKAPNIDLRVSGRDGRMAWHEAVRESLEYARGDDAFLSTLQDPTAEFAQSVKHQGADLKPGSPKFNQTSGETLEGDRALFRFLSHMEMGSVFRLPLWNTGMWMTFKSPSEDVLLEMNRTMLADKIELGRETNGAVYSNLSVYSAQTILATAMANIYQMSLKTDKNPLALISTHDIIPMVLGLAGAIWNNGFVYRRACTHDVTRCTHIVEEKLDITKLLFVNRKALSSKQLAIMAKVKASEVTEDDLVAYREENYKAQKRVVTIRKGSPSEFQLMLRVPSILEHFEAGNVWINDLKDSVNKTLTIDASTNERNAFLDAHSKATLLRQYIHWIDGVRYGEDNAIVQREAISNIMNHLSGQDDIREEIITAVKEYINSTSLTVVGVPTYKCPACKGENKVKGTQESFEGIIPVDVYNTFFLLLVQAVGRIHSRR